MRFMSLIAFTVLSVAFENTYAVNVNCLPCSPSSRSMRVRISEGADPLSNSAKIEQMATQGRTRGNNLIPASWDILLYGTLPDDPDAKYSIYKGPAGTFLSLKIYFHKLSAGEETCNATLEQTPYTPDQVPNIHILDRGEIVKLFCQSHF